MLSYLGLQSVPTEMLFFGVVMAFAASVIFGWTTDLAMKDHGFGPIGNALIGVIGAILGPRIWFHRARSRIRMGSRADGASDLRGSLRAPSCWFSASSSRKRSRAPEDGLGASRPKIDTRFRPWRCVNGPPQPARQLFVGPRRDSRFREAAFSITD